MPALKSETKIRLKEKLLELVNGQPRTTFYFSRTIRRSWGYTLLLLRELKKEGKVKEIRVGNIISWVSKQ